MLFRPLVLRLLPRYRRLLRDGERGKAVVLESKSWGWVSGSTIPNAKLKLKMHYGDGTTAVIERVERYRNLGTRNTAGSTLPMRYEAADHTRVEIDVPTLRRRERERAAKVDRQLVRAAEQRIAKKTRRAAEPPPELDDRTAD